MKLTLMCLLVGLLGVFSASAQHGAALLASYQDASDGDAGIGLLARYQYDFQPEGPGFRGIAQVGRFTGFGGEAGASYMDASASVKLDMDLTALEAAVLYDFNDWSGWIPYAGAGFGYYLPDLSYDFNASVAPGYNADLVGDGSADADNAPGLFVLAGIEKKLTDHLSAFAELRYTSLEITVDVTDSATATATGPAAWLNATQSAQNSYSKDLSLSSFGGSIGLAYLW